MKIIKSVFLIIIVSYLFLFSSEIKAQADSKDHATINDANAISGELILGVPKISDKTLSILTSALEKIRGIKYQMFCPEHKLILVKYNPKIFPSGDDVIKAILKQNIQMPMFVKDGTFEGVMEICQ